MKTKAAIIETMGKPAPYAQSRPLSIEEVELDPPGAGEVLVRIRAAGLCHSDLSVINGDRPRPVPMALGHEAAGEVEEAGPGVTDLKPGDHVIMSQNVYGGNIIGGLKLRLSDNFAIVARGEVGQLLNNKNGSLYYRYGGYNAQVYHFQNFRSYDRYYAALAGLSFGM